MHLLLIFRENLPIQSLEKQGRAPTEGACLSHGGDHYDHRTDFQCHDSAGTEYSRCKDQNNTSADSNSEQQQQVTKEQIKKAVEKLNKNMMSHSEAVFGIHEATNRITIKIIDKDTKKVIKELQPEKTLDMIAKVWEMAGILVDEKR